MIPLAVNQSDIESQLQDGFNVEQFNVKPSFAIVVYTNADQSRLAMTRHKIQNHQLAIGEVINSAQVVELINSESSAITTNTNSTAYVQNVLIDSCVLQKNFDSIMWHRPRQQRTIYLYKERITLNFPPLLFKFSVTKGLQVFAIKHNKRPTDITQLYHAPFMNVYESGQVCTGSMELPNVIGANTIDEVEEEFFNSVFTHPNHSNILRNKKSIESYTKRKAKSGDKMLISELTNTGKTLESLL